MKGESHIASQIECNYYLVIKYPIHSSLTKMVLNLIRRAYRRSMTTESSKSANTLKGKKKSIEQQLLMREFQE